VTTPRFSIAMPAYNAEGLIGRAIDSVLAQTYSDWELVVVDDGSTDTTAQIVRTYAEHDDRIHLVQQQNVGCGGARDAAIRASSGVYVLRFDADDELLPEYLEAMEAFISANPGYDIYSCNGWHVYPDGSRRLARPGEFYEVERSFTLEEMFTATHIFTIAVFTRELFDRIGGIRPDVYCEDLDFWLRAFAAGATHRYTPQPLAVYYVSDSQMTADVCKVCESRITIYQRLIDEGALTPAQIDIARAAVERTRQDEWIYTRRTAVKDGFTRALGPRAGEWISGAMHKSAAIFRPAVARLASLVRRRERHR
jgi:GT2 family glycosyltransferase